MYFILLFKAEQELRNLQVDDQQMAQVMSMGFSQVESRLALRACHGNTQAAVQYIMRKQEVGRRSEVRGHFLDQLLL